MVTLRDIGTAIHNAVWSTPRRRYLTGGTTAGVVILGGIGYTMLGNGEEPVTPEPPREYTFVERLENAGRKYVEMNRASRKRLIEAAEAYLDERNERILDETADEAGGMLGNSSAGLERGYNEAKGALQDGVETPPATQPATSPATAPSSAPAEGDS
jgi:hypothetical protein